MAPGPGLEPGFPEPKSDVLPIAPPRNREVAARFDRLDSTMRGALGTREEDELQALSRLALFSANLGPTLFRCQGNLHPRFGGHRPSPASGRRSIGPIQRANRGVHSPP